MNVEQYKELKKRAIDVGSIPSLSVVPNSIDVVDFAKARMAEIKVLKKDIDDAKYRGARRVFQTLPKSMRRRAASFNIKRLPTRLRMKALEELNKDPASIQKAIKKPPCRRRMRRTRDIQEMSEKRQTDKRWLETHIWHARRAKMVDIWGHRLALHPNEKCLRSSFKASQTGAFIHDASYYRILQLSGHSGAITSFLAAATAGQLDDFTTIVRFNLHDSLSLCLICPVIALVRRMDEQATCVWLLHHPSAAEEALGDLTRRASAHQLHIADLSGQLNIFQFNGRESLSTLKSVLKPVREAGDVIYDSWLQISPTGRLVELLVEDPRFSFPQPKLTLDESSMPIELGSHLLEPSRSIWNGDLRCKSAETRQSDGALDKRRSQSLIPGSRLSLSVDDPCVPVMLAPIGHDAYWLLLPKDWGRPFWRSFIFAKARFGCLDQVRRHEEERGVPSFPYDFPGTKAYDSWIQSSAADLEAFFGRRPKAKRVNYEKMQVPSPFKPDFAEDSWLIPTPVFDKFWTLHGASQSIHDAWTEFFQAQSPSLSMSKALFLGEIVYTGRGTPGHNSIIYNQAGAEIIGYMTSGFFSLTRGRGAGIGCCNVAPLLQELGAKFDRTVEHVAMPVMVRNTNSFEKRPATFSIIKCL